MKAHEHQIDARDSEGARARTAGQRTVGVAGTDEHDAGIEAQPGSLGGASATTSQKVKFYRLALGARFHWRGFQFEKVACSFAKAVGKTARDYQHGAAFDLSTDVESSAALMTEEKIGLWRPSPRPWTDYLTPGLPAQETKSR